jgi:hypothetical protein
MPGYLVHEGATVLCSHAGQAEPTATEPRVKVSGQPVATQPAPYTVAGCAMPPPPLGNGPCVTALWITASVRVTAGGVPIVLLDSQSICVPTGTPLQIVVTQSRVKGT